MKSKKLLLTLTLIVCITEVCSAGTINAWGRDDYGQSVAPAGIDFVAVDGGLYHSVALKADGSLLSWGVSDGGIYDYGQVTSTPVGNDFTKISSENNHIIALKTDGSIVGWGSDDKGQVGDIPLGNNFTEIDSGYYHCVALKDDGSIAAWGIDDGSIFDNGQVTNTPGGNDFAAVAGGLRHSVALKTDGSLVSWGIDDGSTYDYGQVTGTPAGTDFVAIAASIYHNIALKTDGSIVSWGIDDGSSLDFGQVTSTPLGNDYAAIYAGGFHSIALRSDGSLVSWGLDFYGQVTNTPGGNNFAAIGAGTYHSLAVLFSADFGVPISNAITYQGRLHDAGNPGEGFFDFQFELYIDPNDTPGNKVPGTLNLYDVELIDGYFTVELDFGPNKFGNAAKWLKISVRDAAISGPGGYTSLSPLSEITPVAFAKYAERSSWNNLTDMPVGFSDNIDNDSGGDITSVSAGTGLSGGGSSGNVSLSVQVPLELSGNQSGIGVIKGTNSNTSGFGVHGNSTGTNGTGVLGENSNGNKGSLGGSNFGVKSEGDLVIAGAGNELVFPDSSVQTRAFTGLRVSGVRHRFYDHLVASYSSATGSCSCQSGEILIGGGWDAYRNGSGIHDIGTNDYMNYPSGNTWYTGIYNASGYWYNLRVYAICLEIE